MPAVSPRDLGSASAARKPVSTISAVRERNDRWASPESSAPPISTAPKTSSGTSKDVLAASGAIVIPL
jgi:hypothetical protein